MHKTIFLRRLFLAALVIFGAVAVCAAQTGARQDEGLNTKLSKTSEVTFFDLIKKVFPAARLDDKDSSLATTDKEISIRNLLSSDLWGADEAGGETKIYISDELETIDERGKILWLIFGTRQAEKWRCSNCGRRILAAFRVSRNDAELIDAANVKTDDLTGFYEAAPKLRIAPRREAVVIENLTQLSIGSNTFSVIAADKNKFKVLVEDYQKVDTSCGNWIREEAKIRLLKTAGGGYRSIEIRVKTEAGGNNMEDETVETRRRFRYLYVWQPRLQTYKAIVNPDKKRERLLERLYPCRDYRNG